MQLQSSQSVIEPIAEHRDPSGSMPQQVLVPIHRMCDLEAALQHVSLLARPCEVRIVVLHVLAFPNKRSAPVQPHSAEELMEQAESLLRASRIDYETHIVAGELAFSIFDAAEQLACKLIVMPLLNNRPWHSFFPTSTVRDMLRTQRDVPVVFVDALGQAIKGMSHEPA